MGLIHKEREGLKWLKRAAESADYQYNSAPYELGLLHVSGYGDDIFRDEAYAAQLFTQSADLGHVEASFMLGEAYEFGRLSCPRDPALSVHFYTGAANGGHPAGMMALCAWFMVGAEPVLARDEGEAFEWARRAAETGESPSPHCLPLFFNPDEIYFVIVQAYQKRNTQSPTSPKWASARAGIRWRRICGMYAPQTKGMKGRKRGLRRSGRLLVGEWVVVELVAEVMRGWGAGMLLLVV